MTFAIGFGVGAFIVLLIAVVLPCRPSTNEEEEKDQAAAPVSRSALADGVTCGADPSRPDPSRRRFQ